MTTTKFTKEKILLTNNTKSIKNKGANLLKVKRK